MTIDINLDELEATAKAASEGLWEVDYNTPFSVDMVGIFHPEHRRYIVKFDSDYDGTVEVSVGDAAHIAAARPEVVLVLIERVRAAEAALSTPPADDVRETLASRLERSFGPFLAHWPHNPNRFFGGAADEVMAALEVRPHGTVTAPARVLADPEGGCSCEPFDQDAGGGHTEHLLNYEPDCPVHSRHLYDPRKGEWIIDPHGTVTDAAVERAAKAIFNLDDSWTERAQSIWNAMPETGRAIFRRSARVALEAAWGHSDE